MKDNDHSQDILHGIKLKDMVEQLYEHYGWEGLGERIQINCVFTVFTVFTVFVLGI